MDYQKAFNYVNHNILFYKLLKNGITGKFVNLLRSMYHKLGAFIKVNNRIYDYVKDECGTSQGGPLSPNLFRFMLSDLKCYLDDKHGIVLEDTIVSHLLWADDLVLMSESPEGLQQQLNGLQKHCSKYQMIVNETKTKVMHFGKCVDYDFIFNEKKLEIVQEYKYLGVVICSTKILKGNLFKNMDSYLSDKGHKSCFSFMKKCSSLGFISPSLGFKLFDTYTAPVISYGCELWCQTKPISILETVHYKFLKYILGVKESTCNLSVLGETGRYPMYLAHIVKLIKYCTRLEYLSKDILVSKAYYVQKSLFTAGFNVWYSHY